MSELHIERLLSLQLRRMKSRIEAITYKAPQFGAESGEVISGQLGRGEGGRFANIEDIKRASMSNNPLEVFGGSAKRMFQTFYNGFTRDSPFKQDLDASQKKVADLLAASGGNYTDEVKAAQDASDELWRLDTSYRRNMMTADTGLKPGGIKMTIEGLNSDKTGTGQSVAEIMTAAGKDPAGMAQGIGERLVQDAYNYMSVFNQRDELKKLNNASPEINLTTLPEGEKYRIDEAALAEGKIKIDFAYSADKPDGPTKDDMTSAMSDIMMKLDPDIEQYAASFAQANPNFKIGKDGMVKDVLQQAMASLNDDPQKMALENPDLFKFALSAAQGVNLFEGEAGGQAVETPSPAPKPQPIEDKPTKIDPSKYPGNDVEPGLEQKPGKRPPAKPAQDILQEPYKPQDEVPDYIENVERFQAGQYAPLTWDEARNTPSGYSQLPPDQQPPKGFSYAGPVQGPTGPNGQDAINPYAPWRNPQTGEVWIPNKASVDKWMQSERDRRAGRTSSATTTNTTTSNTGASTQTTANNTPTPGPTPSKPAATPGPVTQATPNATPGPVTQATPNATPGPVTQATPNATPGPVTQATPNATPGPVSGVSNPVVFANSIPKTRSDKMNFMRNLQKMQRSGQKLTSDQLAMSKVVDAQLGRERDVLRNTLSDKFELSKIDTYNKTMEQMANTLGISLSEAELLYYDYYRS